MWTLIMVFGLAGVPLGTSATRDACVKTAKSVYNQTVIIDQNGVANIRGEGHMSLAALVCIPTTLGGK